jgi:hypothetical protein
MGFFSGIGNIIKAISGAVATVNPLVTFAISALTLYSAYKAVQAATKPSSQEVFADQMLMSEEYRRKIDADNRAKRSYNHLGQVVDPKLNIYDESSF